MKLLVTLLIAAAAFGQSGPANFTNARLETQNYSGDLVRQIQSDAPAWFAYSITTIKTDEGNCCWDRGNNCWLEDEKRSYSSNAKPSAPVSLERSNQALVLIRAESKSVGKIRLFSSSCPLDAGGLPVIWLQGVPAAASVSYLEHLAVSSADKLADSAVFAIAQHNVPEADKALDTLAQPNEPERLREKVSFWLGVSRGAQGVVALSRILHADPSEKVRDKAVFALSVSPQPEALNFMIQTADNDPSAHVRGQALFWLAQKAGDRSSKAIVNAIQNDPDTGVKKQAVFALSQLPKDEGIPKLIEVAGNQRNPDVRKQAFFWLGQSHDPRALKYIESVLVK